MKYGAKVFLKGSVYFLLTILSCMLLFGCQDTKEASSMQEKEVKNLGKYPVVYPTEPIGNMNIIVSVAL